MSFVLPTGYSFNMDGTALYLTLASVFVAQAAGIDMPLSQQLLMMFTLMLTSKGRRRRPARFARDSLRYARAIRPAASGRRRDSRRRRGDGHGADVAQSRRQLSRGRV